jgi:transposase
MTHNFLGCDRDQPFLPPPDLRDWLPQDHLAWFLFDVVDQLDLQPFYLAHRNDGHGHPSYDPKLLLGVLLCGYCLGVRSSRQLERRYHEDNAFRVLAANQLPDHVTIARFRVRHEHALAGFLVELLKLCAAAGMVKVGVVALDGTKLAGNAADKANRTIDRLDVEVAEILRHATEDDQREDLEHGRARGDELPETLASKAGRLARLRQAKSLLEAEAPERQQRFAERAAASAAAAAAKGKPPRQLEPRARDEVPNPKATANTTDPDSRRPGAPPAGRAVPRPRPGRPASQPAAHRHDGWPGLPRCPVGCLVPRTPWSASQPLLATIHRAGAGGLAAAGRLGDAPVHGQVFQFQPQQPVVGAKYRQPQPVGEAEGDPLVAAAAQGGRRAGLVGDAAVAATKDEDLDELVEDDPVGDARAVAAERVVDLAGGQQGGELSP